MTDSVMKLCQVWRDDKYYLCGETGEWKTKYLIVLAVSEDGGDIVTAVFTSKSNGLSSQPACNLGNPRSGFYVGIPGGVMQSESWIDFSSVVTLDSEDAKKKIGDSQKLLYDEVASFSFCELLRCLRQSEDITKRQDKWLCASLEALSC